MEGMKRITTGQGLDETGDRVAGLEKAEETGEGVMAPYSTSTEIYRNGTETV